VVTFDKGALSCELKPRDAESMPKISTPSRVSQGKFTGATRFDFEVALQGDPVYSSVTCRSTGRADIGHTLAELKGFLDFDIKVDDFYECHKPIELKGIDVLAVTAFPQVFSEMTAKAPQHDPRLSARADAGYVPSPATSGGNAPDMGQEGHGFRPASGVRGE
jgi:hypothetical protein